MDKKAWIIISICCVLLGVNYWFNSNDQKEEAAQQPAVQAAPAEAPAQSEAAPATEQAPAPEPPAAEQPAAGQAPAAEQPAAAPAPERQNLEIAPLVSRNAEGKEVARYHFQAEGGCIRCVEMIGQAIDSRKEELDVDVCINGNAPQGVGRLIFSLSNPATRRYDPTVYHEDTSKRTDTQIVLVGKVSADLTVEKTFTLKPLQQGEDTMEGNAYVLTMNIRLVNTSTNHLLQVRDWAVYGGAVSAISDNESGQFVSFLTVDDGDFEDEDPSDFRHWFSADESYRLVKDCSNLEWVGLMNQYYASALKPDGIKSVSNTYYAAPLQLALPVTAKPVQGLEVAIGVPDVDINPARNGQGGDYTLTYDYFAGPKLSTMLGDLTDNFRKIDRVMDYGMFYYISWAMSWLISLFHSWFGNWGWAIVAMTFVVRAIIWPLYRKSYVSMKRMSLLQPQMKELKEKYPDDPQRVQMEMMTLYRKYGINPLGGCLPMLLQMPIFLSFFWVLQTAAELRGAAWLGWVQDLSLPDTVYELEILGFTLPVNVLPFLMIASMYIMMSLTPQTPGGDGTQRFIMRIMPFFFFFFCYNYASALALYWTTTNLISMLQLFIIRRLPMPQLQEVKQKPGSGKKGFMQRMYEAQKAAMEEQQRRQRRR